MKPPSQVNRRFYLFFFTLLFLVAVPIIVPFAVGYRLDKNFKLVATGGIYVNGIARDSEVFLNGKRVKDSRFYDQGFFVQNLRPDTYFIIVARSGTWSWSKKLEVKEGKVTLAHAVQISQKPTVREVVPLLSAATSTRSSEYERVSALFNTESAITFLRATSSLPLGSEANPILKRKVSLWKKGSVLYAGWTGESENVPYFFCASECSARTPIFVRPYELGGIDFMPGRFDVALVKLEDGIYAIELDKRSEQNTIPLYMSATADYRVVNGETLYIKDGKKLFEYVE
ncbi:MAG TPA: hypothetical protein VI981_01350 [Candidatus Paceibacterota bacterium]